MPPLNARRGDAVLAPGARSGQRNKQVFGGRHGDLAGFRRFLKQKVAPPKRKRRRKRTLRRRRRKRKRQDLVE